MDGSRQNGQVGYGDAGGMEYQGYGRNADSGAEDPGGVPGLAGSHPPSSATHQPMPPKPNWDSDRNGGGGGGGGGGAMGMTPASFLELFRRHWHATIAYCSVFWSFGVCVAFLGPTLLDLGCVTGSDMQTISWVFFAQLLCSLIGSIVAGYLAQR